MQWNALNKMVGTWPYGGATALFYCRSCYLAWELESAVLWSCQVQHIDSEVFWIVGKISEQIYNPM